jgi:16S rRNA (cytidine1402-2'-O)-methyltransferase
VISDILAIGGASVPGVLYVVATPLGNLEDITLRALRILQEVDLIAAEDTRHTRKLLAHYGINTPLTSYYDHIEAAKAPVLIAQLQEGKRIALVSDAGTPSIADPGYRLVKGAAEAGISIVPIPGPSTVAALLSVGGLPTDRFAFEGFLPAKPSQRRKMLQQLKHEERTVMFFESPHRLRDTLADLEEIFGDRPLALGRELTKMYEEVLRGTVSEVRASLQEREVKGEVALLIAGATSKTQPEDELPVTKEIQQLLNRNLSLKEIAQMIGERRGIPKREIYALGVQLKERGET